MACSLMDGMQTPSQEHSSKHMESYLYFVAYFKVIIIY